MNEIQKLQMSSLIEPETQIVSFSGWVAQTAVKEVQTVDVVTISEDYLYYKLTMDGASTGEIFIIGDCITD